MTKLILYVLYMSIICKCVIARDQEIITCDRDNMGSNEPAPHYSGDFRLVLTIILHIIVRVQTLLELDLLRTHVISMN